jgi:hypothetical protein
MKFEVKSESVREKKEKEHKGEGDTAIHPVCYNQRFGSVQFSSVWFG